MNKQIGDDTVSTWMMRLEMHSVKSHFDHVNLNGINTTADDYAVALAA